MEIYKKDIGGNHFFRQTESNNILHVVVTHDSWTINNITKMPLMLVDTDNDMFDKNIQIAIKNLNISLIKPTPKPDEPSEFNFKKLLGRYLSKRIK